MTEDGAWEDWLISGRVEEVLGLFVENPFRTVREGVGVAYTTARRAVALAEDALLRTSWRRSIASSEST